MTKAALITGAGRRLGRQFAFEMTRMGFSLALHARNARAEAEELARMIRERGGRAETFFGDLAEPGAPERLIAEAAATFGRLDVLINNASTFEADEALGFDPARLRRMTAIGLEAPLTLARDFAGLPDTDPPRLIVNLIDQRISNPTDRNPSYTAVKAGLWAASQVLARALAPRIRVVGLAPGVIFGDEGETRASSLAAQSRAPFGGGSISDLRATLRFVLQTESITGQLIHVDGGMHMGWKLPPRPPST